MKREQINNIIIFILIFSSYKGLGLIGTGGVGRGNFNLLSILQLISVIILSLGFVYSLKEKNFFSDKLFKVFIVLIVYIFFELAFSLITLSVSNNYSLSNTLYNFTKIFDVLSIFVIISRIKTKKEFYNFYRFISILAVISAVIVIIVFFVGDVGLFKKGSSIKIGSEFRFAIPSAYIIVTGYFFLLAKILHGRFKKIELFILPFLFLVVFMQMNRSTMVILTGLTILAIIFNTKFNIRFIVFISLFIILLGAVINVFLEKVGVSYKELQYIADYSFNGIKDYNSNNTFIWRLEVLLNNLNYVSVKGHIFGIGFNWQYYDFISYARNHFVMSPTNDNAFANIIIVLGIPGIIIYYLLIKNIFGALKSKDKQFDFITVGIKYSLVYLLLISFFSKGILIGTGGVMINLLFGMTYVHKRVLNY